MYFLKFFCGGGVCGVAVESDTREGVVLTVSKMSKMSKELNKTPLPVGFLSKVGEFFIVKGVKGVKCGKGVKGVKCC